MPYHAYAPLPHWPVTPSPSPSRVSSVTFPLCVCVQSEIYAAARMQAGAAGGAGGEGRRTGCLAGILFYFICINHVACDAIEKYICLLGNFALAFPCSRPPAPAPLLCRACKDMACHAAGPAVVPGVVAVVVVVLASAYVSLGLLM